MSGAHRADKVVETMKSLQVLKVAKEVYTKLLTSNNGEVRGLFSDTALLSINSHL